MYYIIFLAICLIGTILLAVVTCCARINTHKHKKDKYEQIIMDNLKSKYLIDFFLILCERSFDYIRVYFIFQGIAKSVNGLSLLFTVSSLMLTASNGFLTDTKYFSSKEWGVMVSAISIIFVCIIIYVNPTKRSGQYLEAWRNTDKNIVKLIAMLQNYNKEEQKEYISNYEELEKFAVACANELSNGEFKITSDEE
ncbi:MAG: hypothetical protein NC131_15660 [Roseburia sp.]|nr:hypothetical protein [Roseburia sp.]